MSEAGGMNSDASKTMKASELSMLLFGSAATTSSSHTADGSSASKNEGALPTTELETKSKPRGIKGVSSAISGRKAGDEMNPVDVSDFSAAQASQLLKQTHGQGKKVQNKSMLGGTGTVGGKGGSADPVRHRRQNVKRNYHQLLHEMEETSQTQSRTNDVDLVRHESSPLGASRSGRGPPRSETKGEEDEADFYIKVGREKRKRAQGNQTIILNGKGDSTSSKNHATTSSSSDSDSDSDSSSDDERNRRRGKRRSRDHRRRASSSSSSSSSDDDSVAHRRKIRRARAARNQAQRISDDGSSAKERNQRRPDGESSSSDSDDKDDVESLERSRKMTSPGNQPQELIRKRDASSSTDGGSDDDSRKPRRKNQEVIRQDTGQIQAVKSMGRKLPRRRSNSSSDSDTSASSSGSSSNSSSSSSSDSENEELSTVQIMKPTFIPKHRRIQTNQQLQIQQQKQLQAQQAQAINNDKRIRQSRAMVAEIVSHGQLNSNTSDNPSTTIGDQNEFAETGGSMAPPPDDTDHAPNAIDKHEEEVYQMKERELWEVRELLRVCRELEEFISVVDEKRERERRKNMTDEERFREDIQAGRYRKPGEGSRVEEAKRLLDRREESLNAVFTMKGSSGPGVSASAKASAAPHKKMPYYHRGAFYADED